MNPLKKLSIGFLITLLVLIAALAGLLGTESGLRLLVNGANRWVPGLHIGEFSGNWGRGLHLQQVSFTMPGVDVAVDDALLQLQLGCLRRSEVCIRQVTVDKVRVAVDTALLPASEPTPSEPLTRLSTPYPLLLRLLQLNDVEVTVDGTRISLGHFTSGAQWRGEALSLQPTEFNDLAVILAAPAADTASSAKEAKEGTVAEKTTATTDKAGTSDNSTAAATAVTTKSADAKISAAKSAAVPPSDAKAMPSDDPAAMLQQLFASPLLAQLPAVVIPLDIEVAQIHGKNLLINTGTPQTIDDLLISASTQGNKVTLKQLQVSAPQGDVQLTGYARLQQKWPLELKLSSSLKLPDWPAQKLQATLSGALYDKLVLQAELSGALQANLHAQTELATAGLPLELTLRSPKLVWPLQGEPDYRVQGLALALSGSARDYTASLNASYSGKDIPQGKVALKAAGDLEHVAISLLRLDTLQGSAQLKGSLAWRKLLKWRADVNLSGINTAQQWPEWPARINGRLSTKGELQGDAWAVDLPILNLTGQALNKPLDVNAVLSGRSTGRWNISDLRMNVGGNRLQAKGVISDTWKLDALINAPRLDGLLPGLGGQVNGNVVLRGALMTPAVNLDLQANGLRWQDLTIGRLQAKADVKSQSQIQGTVAINLQNLVQGDMTVSRAQLDASGSERQHQLRFTLQGEPVSAGLRLTGSFDRNSMNWRGTLSQTQAQTPLGPWTLQAPVALAYAHSRQQVSISPLCLTNPNAEVCIPQTMTAGASGQGRVQLRRLDLAMFKELLGDETRVKGVVQGQAEFRWQANGGLPTVRANLSSSNLRVIQWLMGRRLPIDISQLGLNLRLENGRLQLSNDIQLKDNGSFNSQINISDLAGRRRLSGNVNINQLSLALLSPMLEKTEKAEGMIGAQLQLGGVLDRPLLQGQLALQNPQLTGAWLPVDITGGNLTIRFAGARSNLNGALQTPEGVLNLTGEADWQRPEQWSAMLNANANRLRIALPPMVRLDVNPDLTFRATPKAMELTGSVRIPWARIEVDSLPESAVDSSSDLVLLNNQLQPINESNPAMAVNTDLMVRLGDDVRLNAFGLKAQLKGSLHVLQNAQGPSVRGQVYLADGRFRSFGQDLVIRKGQLLFVGPPTQPMLNIEAIRNPEAIQNDVVAGIRVTGMADNPLMTIFSEPSMSQAEALSYILRGEPLDDGNSNDNGAMTSALIGIGLSQSSQLVGQIGQAFGISDLALDTQGVGDNSQVVISGYIMPGLQIKYGVGIFDSLAELTLRYRLMPSLYLQAVSGLNQAVDLIYQFEF
ncbi:translocation and assembly module TamB [Plesiomonas shigelloides]|uniref:autotransporter assembly complex protein TamB n=1 Tax=Plesiomonas shigelloides TaxID=703 RepID=UPI001261B8AF|nr:translocation/assembly module TamB domain-containing protein [Plesiomonas shigelloides]KAB7694190.1 translocation and assembly module TamB [Plesiomonas shigelloides]